MIITDARLNLTAIDKDVHTGTGTPTITLKMGEGPNPNHKIVMPIYHKRFDFDVS